MTGAPHWTWGLFTAVGLTLSLHYISKQRRWPHLLGMAVNLMSVLFGGFLYGQTTFYFLIIPAGMFLRNWLKYPARMQALREQAEELAELRAQVASFNDRATLPDILTEVVATRRMTLADLSGLTDDWDHSAGRLLDEAETRELQGQAEHAGILRVREAERRQCADDVRALLVRLKAHSVDLES